MLFFYQNTFLYYFFLNKMQVVIFLGFLYFYILYIVLLYINRLRAECKVYLT